MRRSTRSLCQFARLAGIVTGAQDSLAASPLPPFTVETLAEIAPVHRGERNADRSPPELHFRHRAVPEQPSVLPIPSSLNACAGRTMESSCRHTLIRHVAALRVTQRYVMIKFP